MYQHRLTCSVVGKELHMQDTGIDLFDSDDQYVNALPKSFDLQDDLGDVLQDDLGSDITDDTTP
jgi:hypothetical protein